MKVTHIYKTLAILQDSEGINKNSFKPFEIYCAQQYTLTIQQMSVCFKSQL